MKQLLLALLCFAGIRAQTISGTIFDESKKPMPSVTVYLDGTSISTVSNGEGHFELSSASAFNSVLVFSFVGYETIYISNPFEKPRYSVYMTPQANELKEVVIQAKDEFKRKDKLKVFRQQFLGMTKAGQECVILNEDDLEFRYAKNENVLYTTSAKPLRISNPYLGYELEFNLIESRIQFAKRSVNPSAVLVNYYLGTVVFKEMEDSDSTFYNRRRTAYFGSPMHFMRTVISGEWAKSHFKLYRSQKEINPLDFFSLADENGIYKAKILPNPESLPQKGLGRSMHSHPILHVAFRDKSMSTLIFNGTEFTLDANGNTGGPTDVTYQGEMSKARVGDLLPLDYQP